MKIKKTIIFALSDEEDNAFCTTLRVFEHIGEDETLPQEIRDRASNILNELYEFCNDYFED